MPPSDAQVNPDGLYVPLSDGELSLLPLLWLGRRSAAPRIAGGGAGESRPS